MKYYNLPLVWSASKEVWTTPDGKQIPYIKESAQVNDSEWINISIWKNNTSVSSVEITGDSPENALEIISRYGKYPNSSEELDLAVCDFVEELQEEEGDDYSKYYYPFAPSYMYGL